MTDKRWRKCDSIAWAGDSTTALVNLEHLEEPPFLLSDPAAAVWEAIDGERTTAEIVSEVALAYATTTGVVRHDVEMFLTDLHSRCLIDSALPQRSDR